MDISEGRFWDLPLGLIDGCTPCSIGCDHCWSAVMTNRFGVKGLTYCDKGKPCFTGEIITNPKRLDIILTRRKPTVYAVWNDFFHAEVMQNFRREVYDVIEKCQQHTFLILTKRAGIASERAEELPNVWHGLTICNQQEADEKIPIFLQVPGKKFLSIEPMLGSIDFKRECYCPLPSSIKIEWHLIGCPADNKWGIDAVILGGETCGDRPGRPMKIEWAESIADQCLAASVSLFVKQLHINGKLSKDIVEWPEKLQRRDLPW